MKFNNTLLAIISLLTAVAFARPALVARAEQKWILTNVIITDYLGRNMVNPAGSGRNEDGADRSRDGEPEEEEEDEGLQKSLREQAQELATLRQDIDRLRAERLDDQRLADSTLPQDTSPPRTRPEEVPEREIKPEEVPEQRTSSDEIPEQEIPPEEAAQQRTRPEEIQRNARSRQSVDDQTLARQTTPERTSPERTAPETKDSGDDEYLRFDPSIRFETRSTVVKRAGFNGGPQDRPRGVTVTFDLRDDAAQETLTTCSLAGDLPLKERAPCKNPEYVTWYDHTPFTSIDSHFAVMVEYRPNNKYLALVTKITGRFVVDDMAILDQYQPTYPQGPLTYLNPIDIAKNVVGLSDPEGEAPS